MKKSLNSLLLLLLVPGMLSAATESNYDTSKSQANIYITRFNMYNDYIETGSSIPYEFDGNNKVRNGFINGGLVNKKEVELSTHDNASYLFTGASYFTMTEEGNNVYNVKTNKIDLLSKIENSGTRVTDFVMPTVRVTGTGTRTNPWEFIRKYKVAFNGNSSTNGSMDTIVCDTGISCKLPSNAYRKTGYTFMGWTLKPNDDNVINDGNSVNFTDIPKDNVVILYAKWKANNYTISFDGNGYSSGDTASVACTYDQNCVLPKNGFSKTGYTFKGWANSRTGNVIFNNGVTVKNVTSNPNATVKLYAIWEANKYTIKFDKNSSEAAGNVGSIMCTYDQRCTLPANSFTRVGATFDGWSITNNSATKYKDKDYVLNLTSKPNDTYTLYANWKMNTYNISYNVGSGSLGNFHPNTVKYGEVINISHPSYSCYTFTGWSISGHNTTYAKSGNNSSNVSSSVGSTSNDLYFKNLATNGTVTFTANWRNDCPIYEPPSSGGNSGGGGSSYCDVECEMHKRSENWHKATTKEEKDALAAENEELYKQLPACKSGGCERATDGTVTKNGNCVYSGVKKTC